MNREIKFRIWDFTYKQMFYPTNGYAPGNYFALGVDLEKSRLSYTHELMQFTGLTDKNGKEIYEGDIIDYGDNRYIPVEYIDGCFCICGITSMPTLMTKFSVIGNIYENPDLIK